MIALFRALRNGAGSPGLYAAFAAIIVQRLLHGAFHQAPFAPYSAAEWVIRKSPGPVATYAIDNLGHLAQPLLAYSLVALALALGYAVGRRPAWVLAGAAFVLTLLAAYVDPLARHVAGAIGAASVAAIAAFLAQTGLSRQPAAQPNERVEGGGEVDWDRRQFLARVGLGAVFVAVAGTGVLRTGSRSAPKGPVYADQPAVLPPDPDFGQIAGLSPRITPVGEHYTVDISLQDPVIGESSWRLHVDGAVESPLSLSLADLRAMHAEERVNTLSCISNRVGGDLVGNSRWTGVPLDKLLEMARPRADAVALVAHSYDGFFDGIRLDEIRGKDALIAFGMNGELLSRDHGFPARLLFPNHYGMRNPKWLTRLELKTEEEEGYWAKRGWDRDAVVRTQSRFDAPGDGDKVQSPFTCGGVAWAGSRGIEAVQVSPDDGQSWQPAQMETVLGEISWRRWQVSLELPPGRHALAVRATDGTATPQEATERDPHPSGASGYHRINVTVASA